MDMGTLEAICLSDRTRKQKRPVPSPKLIVNLGFEGDAHAGSWHRQVSMLAVPDIDGMKAKGLPNLKHGDFGENLVIRGVDLSRLGLGSRLRGGRDVVLAVTQRGKT